MDSAWPQTRLIVNVDGAVEQEFPCCEGNHVEYSQTLMIEDYPDVMSDP